MSKVKYIGVGLIVILVSLGFTTELFNNIGWLLLSSNVSIPEGSSILSFKITKQIGSGNGFYGEDKSFLYYRFPSGSKNYIKISREESTIINNFDKHDYTTWEYRFLLGDILNDFGINPNYLEYIKSEVVRNSQTVIITEYRVPGKYSKEVEEYFVNEFNMSPLRKSCCDWQSTSYGQLNNNLLTEIDPFLTGLITMYSPFEDSIETSRESIEYFIIKIELAII